MHVQIREECSVSAPKKYKIVHVSIGKYCHLPPVLNRMVSLNERNSDREWGTLMGNKGTSAIKEGSRDMS